jgi:serine/threonine protein kinase
MKLCKDRSSASREIELMQATDNPNVMSCLEVVNGRNVVMEFMDCDLSVVIKDRSIHLEEIHVKGIAVQIMRGIAAIHQQGFMHRDVTPANVLVNSSTGVVKLTDFGIARTVGRGRRLTQVCTTHPYKSPEGLHGARDYTQAVDIWSAGCVIGELLERKQLFPGHSDIDMLQHVLRSLGNPTEKTFERLWLARAVKTPWVQVSKSSWLRGCAEGPSALARLVPSGSDAAHLFLHRLLQLDPSQRPSAEKALLDTFFSSVELDTFDLSSLPFVRRAAEHNDL